MTRTYATKIVSISGQIATVAAEMMLRRHDIHVIRTKDFPPEVAKVDEQGNAVSFALVINRTQELELDELIRDLRA